MNDYEMRRCRLEQFRLLSKETTDPLAMRLIDEIILELQHDLQDEKLSQREGAVVPGASNNA